MRLDAGARELILVFLLEGFGLFHVLVRFGEAHFDLLLTLLEHVDDRLIGKGAKQHDKNQEVQDLSRKGPIYIDQFAVPPFL